MVLPGTELIIWRKLCLVPLQLDFSCESRLISGPVNACENGDPTRLAIMSGRNDCSADSRNWSWWSFPQCWTGRRRLWAAYFPDARVWMWGRVARRGRGISGGVGEDAPGQSRRALPRSHDSLPFNQMLPALRVPLGKFEGWPQCGGSGTKTFYGRPLFEVDIFISGRVATSRLGSLARYLDL